METTASRHIRGAQVGLQMPEGRVPSYIRKPYRRDSSGRTILTSSSLIHAPRTGLVGWCTPVFRYQTPTGSPPADVCRQEGVLAAEFCTAAFGFGRLNFTLELWCAFRLCLRASSAGERSFLGKAHTYIFPAGEREDLGAVLG